MKKQTFQVFKTKGLQLVGGAIATTVGVISYLAGSIYFYGLRESSRSADAAIVLGAAVWGNEPSPVFRERINHAINLYQQQQIDYIIFTGAQGEVSELAESIVAKKYAIDLGVPANKILIETQSRTTFQNLYYAKQVAQGYQLDSFLIVSDPLHMKRAMLMAEDLSLNGISSPTPSTRYRSFNSQIEFLKRETFFYGLYLITRVVISPANNPNQF